MEDKKMILTVGERQIECTPIAATGFYSGAIEVEDRDDEYVVKFAGYEVSVSGDRPKGLVSGMIVDISFGTE